VGPPPAFGGRRPCAEAADSPRRGLAAPPNVPLPIQNPFAKIWYMVTSRAPKGHGTRMYDPPSPRPFPPLRRGERVEGVGGCNICRGFPSGKRDILGRYRLKRKSVPGNSIRSTAPDEFSIQSGLICNFVACGGELGFSFWLWGDWRRR
jgi:hypothetical protein